MTLHDLRKTLMAAALACGMAWGLPARAQSPSMP